MADSNFKARRLGKKALRDAILDQVIEVFKRASWNNVSPAEFQDVLYELCAVCTPQELRAITTVLKIRSRSH